MNTKALEELERVVRDAPDDHFCMNVIHCGTARCAFGWTLVDPWFIDNTTVLDSYKQMRNGANFGETLGKEFGISREDANNLFGGELAYAVPRNGKRVTKLAVIANIRRLLRGEPTRPYKQ